MENSVLQGCCIWLLLATFFNLPVSGTHSIVGATIGFALVMQGSESINWKVFAKIGRSTKMMIISMDQSALLAFSWIISPLSAGAISIGFFMFIRKFILQQVNSTGMFHSKKKQEFVLVQNDQLNIGLRWLPLFYGATIMLNVFSIIHSAPPSSNTEIFST